MKERKIKILEAIIRDYISTAEPVGSRSLSKKYDLGVSPATIRNEMSDLEDMGYLIQLHTSSGRIPSEKAYRLYVDQMMRTKKLGKLLQEDIHQGYSGYVNQLEKIMDHTAMVLAQMTSYTSIILSPQMASLNCKHVQLIPLADERILIVFVTKEGVANSYQLSLSRVVEENELQKLSNLLNFCLKDNNLGEVNTKLVKKIDELTLDENELLQEVIPIIKELLLSDQESRVYSKGVTNLFNYPEFQDLDKVRKVMEMVQEKSTLAEVLNINSLTHTTASGIEVRIGEEIQVQSLKDFSLITTEYEIDGKPIGSFGVLGPIRMDYDHVASVLTFLRQELNEHIKKLLSE
jgi:heat-inducible transcriptional repressor